MTVPESRYITSTELREALEHVLTDEQRRWLRSSLLEIESSDDPSEKQLYFAAMSGRQLHTNNIESLPGDWRTDEAARVLFLLCCIDNSQDDKYEIIRNAFRMSDDDEKKAYLKGLSMLDNRGELTDLALQAGRTNNTNLFAAIALDNLYPAERYDDRAFIQLTLKALFLDLNIIHIIHLEKRINPELSQKCMELVHERLAAGRKPPFSIWLAIDIRHLADDDQALYLKFLSDTDAAHRYYSLLALKKLELLEQYQTQLISRRNKEQDPSILQLLT